MIGGDGFGVQFAFTGSIKLGAGAHYLILSNDTPLLKFHRKSFI